MVEDQHTLPSRLAERFLTAVCKRDLIEEILGDLHQYYEESAEKPIWKRKIHFWFHVLNFLRPFALKNLGGDYRLNQFGLLINYVKISWRNLIKNPLSSFINIIGLSFAIGICLVAYAMLEWDYTKDQFHENKDEVFLATTLVNRNGSEVQYGSTPGPLAKMLKEEFSQVSKVCRVKDAKVVMKYQNKVFHEEARYTDPEFLEMLTFPLKWGSPASLKDPNSIILSEEMSIKYFGYENPIGREVFLVFDPSYKKAFTVAGVAEPFPVARTIDFDLLLNIENVGLVSPNTDFEAWAASVDATFIQLNDKSDIDFIKQNIGKYILSLNESQSDRNISSLSFEPLASLAHRSGDIVNSISYELPPEKMTLPVLGLIILIIACFNYINMAISSATKRLKEIGLRKAIGANRRKIIIQFLTENLIITCFAVILGIVLCVTLMLPWNNMLIFKYYFGFDLALELLDMKFWIFLLAIVLVTGIASGLYPSLFIARFKVTDIFAGSVRYGKKNKLTKAFLLIQLILTSISLTVGVALIQNTTYLRNSSWGYDQQEILYVNTDHTAFQQFYNLIEQNANVLSLAGSEHHLGATVAPQRVMTKKDVYEVHQLLVDANYLETMGLKLKSGRFFVRSGDENALVVNEMFLKNLDISQSTGQSVELDGSLYEIIGVVEDFHTFNFDFAIRPTIFMLAELSDYKYLSIRVRNDKADETYKELEQHWAGLFPEIPFQGGFQRDILLIDERANEGAKFILSIAFVAVMLVTLGLYGLVILNVAGRNKELCIRKALGANIINITKTIAGQYTILFVTALVIAVPLSYFAAEAFLDLLYFYHMPVSSSAILFSVTILLLVLFMVAFTQVKKVSGSNPTDGLKVE